LVQLATGLSGSLTKEQRDSMTPSQIIDELKKGNERFRSGRMTSRN
jgi:carbonic anhydrase